jgi:hypothetical protein
MAQLPQQQQQQLAAAAALPTSLGARATLLARLAALGWLGGVAWGWARWRRLGNSVTSAN